MNGIGLTDLIYSVVYSGVWSLVILQRQFPASLAQAICDGLYDVVENSKPLGSGFAADNIHYYPLGVGHDSDGLGFDFAWYSLPFPRPVSPILLQSPGPRRESGPAFAVAQHLKNYVKQILSATAVERHL